MLKPRLLSFLLVALTLAGCASTERAAAPAPAATVPAAPAASEEPAATPDVTEAPEDWYRLDAEDTGFYGAGVERSYRTVLADRQPQKKVVVAVLDSGVDITHEDLRANIWTNEDEVPGNGVDDDRNGYVDDVHGWNFIGGPDGRHISYDTFEVTRELVRLRDKYEAADPARLSADERREYEYYQEVGAAYEQKLQETRQIHANLSGALQALRQATRILQDHLGKEDFTLEEVAALQPRQEMVQKAQGIVLYLAQLGIDEAELAKQVELTKGRIEYGLNPDFDPRSIVGDDYDDLSERIYGNNDVAGPDPYHGTHVAGIIAAARGNAIGSDGIAGNVEIMVVRVVPNGDERDKDVANAIRYAVDNGADIINMSFGKEFSPQKEAVDAALRHADAQGVLLVHGAGNDAENIDVTPNFPSRRYLGGEDQMQEWIEVGASSWEGADALAASFSNYGKESVDLFAPGVSIFSTVPEQGYDRADGTSMAAPVVSGVAALVMSYYPELTADQVREILLRSAVPFAGQQVQKPGSEEATVDFGTLSRTGGIVNAYRALQLAEEMTR